MEWARIGVKTGNTRDESTGAKADSNGKREGLG